MQSYYDILGVDITATETEIRKAYRQLAKTYHPDIAGSEHADKFKEITEAYNTLTDPQKKQLYDMQNSNTFSADANSFFSDSLFNTFFNFGAQTSNRMSRDMRGEDIVVKYKLSIFDIINGKKDNIVLKIYTNCSSCDGFGDTQKRGPKICSKCGGSGTLTINKQTILGHITTNLPCDVCEGYGNFIENKCSTCAGQGRVVTKKSFDISVPGGIRNGDRILVEKSVNKGKLNGENGDIYLDISYEIDPFFTIISNDIHCIIVIPVFTAIFGGNVVLQTFDGDKTIQINEGTNYADEIKIQGFGIPNYNGHRGNLICHVKFEIPKKPNLEKMITETKNSKIINAKLEKINGNTVFDKLKDLFI